MKQLATYLLLIACFPILWAQNFESFNISQNLADPRVVETYDLDGDGLDEMIVASTEGIFLYQNQGNSEFEKIALLDSIQGIFRLSLFDWGADGDQDIFFTTFGLPQRVGWLENDGNQNFTYHLITDTIPSPFHLRPFDIDQDNDVDLLLSSSSTDELYWLKNNGLDNFTSIDTIGSFINHFDIADLNGDNDWDIIFGRAYTGFTISEVRAFQNDGNNNFTMQVLRTGFSVIHEVFADDINGDNFFDILVVDYNGDRISWLDNDGSYGFSTQNTIINNFDGPTGVALRDVNGDGRKDVIAGSYNADEIYYFQGIGTVNSFSFSSGSLIYNELNSIGDLAIGNFDNQNNLDFVHTDLGEDGLSVWINNGSQTFTQDMLAFSFDSPRAFDMQDLDGDGDQDMAAVSNDGDMVAWMENLGKDIFETHILLTNYEEPHAVRINDLDDDGDFDIIATSNDDDLVTWWQNDGLGNFTVSQIATNLNGPRGFWIEDFDGDGDKDIAVVCFWLFNKVGTTGAQLLQNDGNENFTVVEIEDDVRAGATMRGADMNGDTLVDVVISSYLYTQSKLRIAVNNGSGFGITTVDDLLCEDFEVVDFDGDQDQDILAIDFSLDSLYFYENLGNLQFARHTLTYEEDLYGISPRDFDGDGDLDIIFYTGCNCFTNGSRFEWGIFRNDGAGNLTKEYWLQNQSLIRAMETFDYENDGDIDIVLGFDYADRITMYKNLDVDCHLQVDLVANGPTSFCEGDSVVLNSSITDTSLTYQWFRNNLPIANATSPQFTADSSGIYKVAVSDTSCTAFSAPQEVIAGSSYTESMAMSFCDNDSIILDSIVISAPGSYTVNYLTGIGCDSTVTYQVTQNAKDSSFVSASICSGSSYQFGSQQLTQSGLYQDTLSNMESCDSVVYLNLTVNSVYSQNQTLSICSGDSALLPGGNWVTQAGTFVDSLQSLSGCDSIWSSHVIVRPVFSTSEAISICQGDSLLVHGDYQSATGTYADTLFSLSGCDSIHSVSLSVLSVAQNSTSVSVCQGDSVLIGGAFQKQAGTYYDTLQAANSCDSILITSLSVFPTVQNSASLSICQGDSIFLANAWRRSSGTYTDTLQAANSCDSLFITSLSLLPSVQNSVSLSLCQGDSVFLANAWRKTSGTYTDTLQAVNGCDSILTSLLSVAPLISISAQESICQGDSLFLAGAWQTAAGSYVDTISVSNGCDTLLSTNLTVNPVYNNTLQLSICQGDSTFLGGTWRSTAGTYVDLYGSINQCDSSITTQLSVISVDTGISRNGNTLIASAAPASYRWLDCNTNYAIIPGATSSSYSPVSNGSYAVEVTQNGCADTSRCITINGISLKEGDLISDLVLYPNPSSGVFTLSGTVQTSERYLTLLVVDSKGGTVFRDNLELNKGSLFTELNLEHLPDGSYILRIQSTDGEIVKSAVIFR
jgi:hypothetical protein